MKGHILIFLFCFSCGISGCSLVRLSQPSAGKLLSNPDFSWASDTTTHFIVNYQKQSPAEERLGRIRLDLEESYAFIELLLDESYAYKNYLQVFIVSSRSQMKHLIGYETNGTAFSKTEVLCYIVSNNMTLGAKHELLHVMAMNQWGIPDRWINEGLAVYADDQWHGHDLHALSSHLNQTGEMLAVGDLISNFRKRNDLVTYPLAGSLVKYIYETYGVASVKSIWQGKAISQALGIEVEALEKEWLASLPEPITLDYSIR